MKPPRRENALHTIAKGIDPQMQVDPSPAVRDYNTVRGLPPKNPADNEQGLAKGGKVRKVVGKAKPGSKDEGLVGAQKGEYMVRKAAAHMYGDRKMAAVNAGTARVSTSKKRK